jgi:subtilisin family serine protease
MSKKWVTVALLTLVLALPGSGFSEGLGKPGYVPGEILVKFRSGVSKSNRNTAHSSHGCKLVRRFKRVQIDHVKTPDGWTVEEAVAAYRLRPDVEYAEPNYYRYAGATFPNDPDFGDLWGLDNIGQAGGTPDADIDCPEAWDTQTGDPNVIVAVVDSGADLDHEDLVDNIWRNMGEDWVGGIPGNNGVDDDGNGKTDDYYGWNFIKDDNDPDDDNDHGTHCSGTIGAVGNNGIGISGVNWQASIMALKFLDKNGDGTAADEIKAIEYAIDNGAQVISASFSGYYYSQAEYDAIWDAGDAGILFVAAAGNDGDDIDLLTEREYPASYNLANIIAVAATDRNDALASFSNYGVTSVDVAAPGVYILSTTADDGYAFWNGTSMATPHVAGLAALIWAENPGFTYSEVKDRILNGVDVIPGLMGVVGMAGRINANNSINPPAGAPDAPGGLDAAGVSTSQVDLTWTDNASDESGFKIERAKLSEGIYRHIMTLGPNTESYNDVGLSEATTYYYKVRAFNAAGDSGYSNEDDAATHLAEPGGLSAAPVSDSRINLSWTDSSNAESGFRIERKQGSGGTYSEIATVSENVTTYGNTGLEASTTYYYRVNAYDGGGNSEYSNEVHATTSSVSSAGGGDDGTGDLSNTNVDQSGLQPAGDGGGGGGCFIGTTACGTE